MTPDAGDGAGVVTFRKVRTAGSFMSFRSPGRKNSGLPGEWRKWHESRMDLRGVFPGEGDESAGTSRPKRGESNWAGVHAWCQ